MEYRASLDVPSKIITVVIFLLLGFIVYMNSSLRHISPWISVFSTFLFLIVYIVAFLYGPKKYIVKNGMLIIDRPVDKVKIPLSEIAEARLLVKGELGTLMRTGGSGGVFGYYGSFRSSRIGKLKLYTTRQDKRILITTVDDNRLIISPDDVSILELLRPSR